MVEESLWGEEFIIPEGKEKTKKILNKISKPKEIKVTNIIKNKKVSLAEKLKLINENVIKILGKQKDNILLIRDRESLHNYITKAIQNNIIAIDTETNNSLDPITCKLMGPCIYTPGEKQVYIPLNHRNPETKERLDWQLIESDITEEFQRLIDADVFIIMHNGKFDYQILKCTCGLILPINWDTLIGAKLINENEHSAGLKQQYISKIDPEQEKYSLDHLFEGVEYADVDPEIFALYAAMDPFMTYKLYEYQLPIMGAADFSAIYRLFKEVEMPLVPVLAEMELQGMEVDQIYSKRLSIKFHKRLENIDKEISNELANMSSIIESWKLTAEATQKQNKKISLKQYNNALRSKSYDPSLYSKINGEYYKISKPKIEQLNEVLTPNSLASPLQLGILLYDILKCPVVNKEKPYATGEAEIKSIYDKTHLNLCNLLLSRREVVKLLSTYIDSIPELAKRWPDGRVRTHFNQYGAQTGRLSSSDPLNFQNIPSHEKSIRMLFKARKGYKIIGADYAAQEPRIVAHFSKDKNMLDAYLNGRDLYSVIAAMSFDKPYEECLEFYPEGTKIQLEGKIVTCGRKTHQNKDGKERRTAAKSILLGLLYGRGAASVGEQIGKTREQAEEILQKFFNAFPSVKVWITESQESCRKLGYVEDVAGRRRRLPDINLPKFTVRYKDKNTNNGEFNPFIGCKNREGADKLIQYYKDQTEKCRSRKQSDALKFKASSDGIEIINNGGFISQAERQCVNARVQGSAATLTKCALIAIFKDERLKALDAHLINTVHDEILMEVKAENAEEACKYLSENMVNSAKTWIPIVPMASDTYSVDMWYADEYEVLIQKDYKKLIEDNVSPLEARQKVIDNHFELFPEQINYILDEGILHNCSFFGLDKLDSNAT